MDPDLEKLRKRVSELTPFPGWSKPIVIEPDPDVESLRMRVREIEIKIAVEPLRERVREMVVGIVGEEERARSCEGDRQKTISH